MEERYHALIARFVTNSPSTPSLTPAVGPCVALGRSSSAEHRAPSARRFYEARGFMLIEEIDGA
jgi:hypothetical protein